MLRSSVNNIRDERMNIKSYLTSSIIFALLASPTSPRILSQAPISSAASPTLEATLKFIGDLMVAESPITFTTTARGGNQDSPRIKPDSISYSGFRQNGCVLLYELESYGTHSIDFSKSSSLAIRIDTYAAELNRLEARDHDSTTWSTSPEIYMVNGFTLTNGMRSEEGFALSDREKAGRLVKAINHAIELCGGAKDTPF